MFKKSKIKIVASIMTIMTLIIVGTIMVTYFSSYREMKGRDDRMLEEYVRIRDDERRQVDLSKDMAGAKSENKQDNKPDNKQDNKSDNRLDNKTGNKQDNKSDDRLNNIPENRRDNMPENIAEIKPDTYKAGGDFRRDVPPRRPEDDRAMGIAAIYSVLFDADNSVKSIDNKRENITDDELIELAKEMLLAKSSKGKMDGYNYIVMENKDGTLVAFMDSSSFDRNVKTLLKYTIIFGGVSLIIVFAISVFLANIIIRPLEQNYIKQKQFISDAGHELKTPVTVISTNAEVLAAELGENKWLDNIVYENEKMTLLIRQLLELTRTETNEVRYERTDLSHIVVGEILPFESVAFEKGIEIDYENIEEDIYVNGNTAQLSQLVSILIDNAIEHSTGGNIAVELLRNHGKVILTVINNGAEISKEKQELLFERFYRGDASRNSDGNHYGLGLAIAKSIVDAHKGSINVECRDGKVIFKIILKEG